MHDNSPYPCACCVDCNRGVCRREENADAMQDAAKNGNQNVIGVIAKNSLAPNEEELG